MRKGLSDRRNRRDRFHRRARKEGFRARAVFKLEEIDQRLGLVDKGARVLDLGCAPGSWLQYCRTRVGPSGVLVGLDRHPLAEPIRGARVHVGDIYEISSEQLLGDLDAFDVVLSDMAPDTTGIRHVDQARSEALFERALEIAETTLAEDGNFLAKLFQGPEFARLLSRCRTRFRRVKVIKPESSRTRSLEQYVTARGFDATAR
jgi:23S rRNA (uridine2552-2'-O)-methyltransferase